MSYFDATRDRLCYCCGRPESRIDHPRVGREGKVIARRLRKLMTWYQGGYPMSNFDVAQDRRDLGESEPHETNGESEPREINMDYFKVWLINSMPPETDLAGRVEFVNALRRLIHEVSPFAGEPVDLVQWVPAETVHGNSYNPNSVAPPEMELLRLSITADGYTQPIVSMTTDDGVEVVDGFHRHRVGKECENVRDRVQGFLPVVEIRSDRTDVTDRIAATIRHNRARGKHQVSAMSDIVIELKRRNWSNDKIGRELGMEADEVLRLCQMTGLAELFADDEFSMSWDVDDLVGSDEDALAEVAALLEEK